MKKIFVYCFLFSIFTFSLFAAQPSDNTTNFQLIIGPRVGIGYTNLSPEKFSEKVNEVFGDLISIIQLHQSLD